MYMSTSTRNHQGICRNHTTSYFAINLPMVLSQRLVLIFEFARPSFHGITRKRLARMRFNLKYHYKFFNVRQCGNLSLLNSISSEGGEAKENDGIAVLLLKPSFRCFIQETQRLIENLLIFPHLIFPKSW